MKKRILAFLLVLVMVLSLLPAGVVAEEQPAPENHTDAHDCGCCEGTVTWIEWNKKNEFPSTPGHYYLTENVDLIGWRTIGAGTYTICLNGHYIKAENGKSVATVGDGTVLTISDCTAYYDAEGNYQSGYVSGAQSGTGGCFYVSRGGTLNLESGAIKNSHSTANAGGAVYLQGSNATKKAVFNMTGGEITGCSAAKNGGAVYVNNGVASPVSEFNMSGGRIHNNTASKAGAVYCVMAKVTISGDALIENHTIASDMGAIGIYGGQLIVSGGKICGNTAANGGGVLVQSGSSMTMSGGEITGNTATNGGGGIYISTGCEFTMSGGTVSGNNAVSGGGIYHNGSIATHSGGTIKENTATTTGGGVNITGGAQVSFDNTSITKNHAQKAGGIYGSTNSVITMSGGTVTGNTADTVGGGIYVNEKNKSLTVEGDPVVNGNTAGGMNSNLHLEGTRIITLGALTEGAQILVTVDGDSRAISNASTTDYSAYFDADSAQRMVSYHEDGKLYLEVSTEHQHCTCTAAAQNCDHTKQIWIPWENASSLPNESGYYYLATNVELSTALELAGDTDIKLCLNGKTVTANGPEGKSGDRIVGLTENAKFTITDCSAKVDADGNYTAGQLTGASMSAVMIRKEAENAVFNMYGGIITGNTSAAGGAACVQSTGTFNMYGGEVSGNTVTGEGGAFFVSNGFMNVFGGSIRDNIAGVGAGIYAQGTATITLAGGTITDNSAATAGGVYVGSKCQLVEVSGAPVITGNTAAGEDSNLYLSATQIITLATMNDRAKVGITAEGAPRAFSGVWEQDYSSLFKADNKKQTVQYREDKILWLTTYTEHTHCLCGADAKGCDHTSAEWYPWESTDSLPGSSGNYYLTADVTLKTALELAGDTDIKLCLNGHNITVNGPEGKSADRIFGLSENAHLTITDCTAKTVDGKYTAGKMTGGSLSGILFRKQATGAVLNMYGGILTGNKAAASGGAVTVQGVSTFNLYGGEISGNEAVEHGGAFFVDGAAVNVYGGTITGNKAGATGGGIYAKGTSTITLAGGQITDNSAETAGGVYVGGKCNPVSVEGAPVITGNTAGNLYLSGDRVMTVGKLTEGAKISVTAVGSPRAISETTQKDDSKFFTGDNEKLSVQYHDSKLWLHVESDHVHCLCGADAKGCDHTSAEWYPWESTDSLPSSSGNYYLTADVTLKTALELAGDTDIKLCLNGHNITVNGPEGKSADRIFGLSENAHLTITDCTAKTVDGKYTAGKMTGGSLSGILFRKQATGAVLNMYGGILTGNKAAASGGAVTVQGVSTFNLYGGEISGNEAVEHGGAFFVDGAAVNVYGGTITGNKAGATGGGIYAKGTATITLAGGQITDNSAETAGGVYVGGKCNPVSVEGAPVITGNTAGNLYLSGDRVMTVGKLTEGAKISVTAEGSPRAIMEETQQNCSLFFTADNGKQTILYQNGQLWIDVESDHVHCLCAAKAEGCDHAAVKWYPWESATSLPTSGNFYLTADVTLKTALELAGNKDLKLCLNGHNITIDGPEGKSADRIFGLSENAHLTITDCTAKTVEGKYTAGKMTGGSLSGILFRKQATDAVLNMYGGILTGNKAAGAGGAVCVQGVSTFNMYGGEISGNEAVEHGGAFYVDGAALNVYGGSITGNTAKANGGGIYAKNSAKITIYGGEVSGNTAADGGGMAIAAKTELTVSGGEIKNNTASSGGGVILTGGSSLKMTGGSISNNTAKLNGGAAYMSKNTSVVMSGGKVSGNTTQESGAAFYLSYAEITLSGGEITGNTAKKAGAAVYLSKSTGNLTGTYIGGNTAQNAAGIMVSTSSHLNMSGGTIADGTVEDRGCGVYHNKSTGTYTGGTISGNKAGIEGAAIYATGSTLTLGGVKLKNNQSPNSAGLGLSTKCDVTMTAGEISGNSSENGAGVLIASKSNFKMTGGKISNNTVTNSGGGIYLSKNAFMTISGGEISGNTACGYGGGIYTYSPCTIGGALIKDNQVVGCADHPNPRGGGVFIGSQTAKAHIHDCQFIGNHSFKDGGGLYGQNQNFITVENVKFENNIADNKGGGMYINLGCYSTMRDITLIGNSSTSTGSGMWAADDLSIHNLVATGNTSTGTGGAVYITTANYDGESYVTNLVKISGLIQVYDNVGNAPDFVLSEGAFATIGSEGLAEGSRINVILRAGVLTQTLFGNYDYEGGNLIYTVTPGTRSATDPEKLPGSTEPQPEQTEPTEQNTDATTPIGGADEPTGILVSGRSIVLWSAVAIVVAAAAVIIPVAIKKKKN